MGRMIGFIIWAIVGCFFIGLGIFSFISKNPRPLGFWANAKVFEVSNVKKYNHAMGILWCVFGIVFIVLGIPLLGGQNNPLILFSVIGAMAEAIAVMVVYVLIIEKKFRKK